MDTTDHRRSARLEVATGTRPRTPEPAPETGEPIIRAASLDSVRDYLEQIGRVRLLKPEEEIELAKAVEAGVLAREQLEGSDASGAERTRLRRLVREGRAAHRRFITANLRLVVVVAKRYTGHGVPLMDLIQEGNLGLIKAVDKFDYTLGYKFSTYAMWWIRQAVVRGLAESYRLIRVPVHSVEKINMLHRVERELEADTGRQATRDELAEAASMPRAEVERLLTADQGTASLETPVGDDAGSELGDLVEDDDAPDIADAVSVSLRHAELHRRVEALPEREAEIVRMRYGIDRAAPMSQAQVGLALGVSRQRIRQIEQRALTSLRCPALAD